MINKSLKKLNNFLYDVLFVYTQYTVVHFLLILHPQTNADTNNFDAIFFDLFSLFLLIRLYLAHTLQEKSTTLHEYSKANAPTDNYTMDDEYLFDLHR